jgi:hypothetical protein
MPHLFAAWAIYSLGFNEKRSYQYQRCFARNTFGANQVLIKIILELEAVF